MNLVELLILGACMEIVADPRYRKGYTAAFTVLYNARALPGDPIYLDSEGRPISKALRCPADRPRWPT